MEHSDKNFHPQESIQLIHAMIQTTKKSIGDSSHYFLLWGWSVVFGCLFQFYLKAVANYEHHYLAWFVTPITLGIHFYFVSRDEKKVRVQTFIDEATGYVWAALAFSFIVFGFVFAKIGWQYCFPFFILMYGIGTYVTGSMLKFKPLIFGGICCGLLSCIAPYVPYDYQILLTAFAMLVSYIIPGHILRNRYNKSKAI